MGDSSVAADGGGKRCFDRTIGCGLRPADGGPFNALMKLERRFEQDDLAGRLCRNVGLLSLTGNLQVSGRVSVPGMPASWPSEHSCGGTSGLWAHLLGGRLLWQLGDKWDLVYGARFFGAENGGGKHTLVRVGQDILEALVSLPQLHRLCDAICLWTTTPSRSPPEAAFEVRWMILRRHPEAPGSLVIPALVGLALFSGVGGLPAPGLTTVLLPSIRAGKSTPWKPSREGQAWGS